MAGITLTQAEAKLAEYLAAETAVLNSQEYKIADRSNKKALLADIQEGIDIWDRRAKRLSRGGIRIIGGTPS